MESTYYCLGGSRHLAHASKIQDFIVRFKHYGNMSLVTQLLLHDSAMRVFIVSYS